MANRFDKGDLVRCTGTFTTAGGAAQDPTTVKVSIRTPARVVTTYVYGVDGALVKDSTGVYHVDVDANQVGTWYVRWWATGTGQAAGESPFFVNDPKAE